ncbi:MAG: LegC family aminotransferase [Fusobacteriaceae bacterium]
MKTIGLSVPNLEVEPILENLRECLESGWISTGGRFIPEFEGKIKNYLKCIDAVGIQSGTAGLHTALRVFGVDRHQEVIAPTLTFIAAVNPITYQGAEPVFIGCDHTLCMDPILLEKFCKENCLMREGVLYNKKSGKPIRVIVVVHVFGNMADMESIMDIAERYNLKVLEDATEALGTYYTEGRYVGKYAGTIGHAGVLSFNANKIITTGGGGMVISQNQEFLDQVRFLSVQAKTDPLYFIHDDIGYNYRMLGLEAALGTIQIDDLEKFIENKIKNFKKYQEAVDSIDGLSMIPFNRDIRANHWFYSVVVDREKYGMSKDELLQELLKSDIQTRPIWGLIHQQKPYQNHEAHGTEIAEWYYNRVLNIPCSSNLTEEERDYVISKLKGLKKEEVKNAGHLL